jgi:hypothetical protein
MRDFYGRSLKPKFPSNQPALIAFLLSVGEGAALIRKEFAVPHVSQETARLAKTGRRAKAVQCPRCGTAMDEVARIAPSFGDPGLIGYECPSCVYVTSELLQPNFQH